jgi:hypothetical protein
VIDSPIKSEVKSAARAISQALAWLDREGMHLNWLASVLFLEG